MHPPPQESIISMVSEPFFVCVDYKFRCCQRNIFLKIDILYDVIMQFQKEITTKYNFAQGFQRYFICQIWLRNGEMISKELRKI